MKFNEINWVNALIDFGIDKKFLSKREGPCPICAGTKRFRFNNKSGTGDWYCNQCLGGNGFSLIKKATDLTDAAIYTKLRKNHNLTDSPLAVKTDYPVSDELSPEEVSRNRKRLVKVWKGTVALRNNIGPVQLYLGNRVHGGDLTKLSKYVRFHPSLDYYEIGNDNKYHLMGNYPAMVCKVVDGKGNPITLHRTYLTKDGRKALVEEPKMQMAGVRKLKGAAIPVFINPRSRVLGICEGVEKAWAIATAYQYKMTVWSLLNAFNLSIADIPLEDYDEVIIFGDFDKFDVKRKYRPGEHYAKLGYQKFTREGFKALIKLPPREGVDFDEMWNEYFDMKSLKAA